MAAPNYNLFRSDGQAPDEFSFTIDSLSLGAGDYGV